MGITEKEIKLFQKLSIIQYLLKNNLNFINRDNEIIFDLFINDDKVRVQNLIGITKTHDFIFCTYFPILKDFIPYERLLFISNNINKLSGIFSTYVQEEIEEDYNLFYVKAIINLIPNMVVGDEFWDFQLKRQIDNVSTITNFLFFDFPKSESYKKEKLDESEFKLEIQNSIQSYSNFIKILRREDSIINLLSKEELEEELGKEFEKFSTGKKDLKNTFRLNLIISALQKFNEVK